MIRSMYWTLAIALGLTFVAPGAEARKPPRITAVPLVVTVEGNPTDLASPFNIRSDGGGDYRNGVDGVAASFETDGNFVVREFGGRGLYFEYDAPLAGVWGGDAGFPGDPATGIAPDGADPGSKGVAPPGCSLSTLRTGSDALQNMVVGASQCLRMNFRYDGPGRNQIYRSAFQRTQNGALPAGADATAWGVVTRESDDVWTIEPGLCAGGPALAEGEEAASRLIEVVTVKNRATTTNNGRFNLPFRITLTRQ